MLDKTGTLTEGKPKVVESFWISESHRKSLMDVLLAIENNSNHPLAKAILAHYESHGDASSIIETFVSKAGFGVSAQVSGSLHHVGSLNFMKDMKIKVPETIQKTLDAWNNKPYSTVFFSDQNEIVAAFAIGDNLRPEATTFISQLKTIGITPVVLSGDNSATVRYVAESLDVEHYFGHQSPSDKANKIIRFQEDGKQVAMVGDGINDAVALAQSDVGIAMGNGTDIAMESAGVTLMHSDLTHLLMSIRLSKATIKTIKQNLFWAFIYNLIAIPVAAGLLYPVNGFLLNPMIAGAAMSMSSISVLLNSLRLKRQKL
ncbi:MAG: Cu2+-exporting ATPase [Bacteroidia bacterium]